MSRLPPDWLSIRNFLLVFFMAVWSIVMIAGVIRGEAPSADDWAALGIGLAAIVALFRDRPQPPDSGGGGSP